MKTQKNAQQLRDSRIVACFWNGGGGIIKRLEINPVLRDLLNNQPDIFVYGESELSKPSGLF